jgi:PAS domain S-box-containing protein
MPAEETDRRTLLLVEDDSLLASNEAMQLQDLGYDVVFASTGEQAIETVASAPDDIDLILMDINLGAGMDGTEAAREILGRFDIPVLFLSSHTEPEIVRKTERITNYGYVVKSSHLAVLDASIKMAFKLHSAYASIRSQKMELEAAYAEMQAANDDLMRSRDILIERETSLRESEGRMRTMFEQAPMGMALIEAASGRIREVNAEFVEVVGRGSQAELAGLELMRLVHQDDAGGLSGGIERLNAREKSAYSSGSRLIRPDGSLVWANITIAPIRTGERADARLLCMVEDVTERVRLERSLESSLEKLDSAQEVAKIGFWSYSIADGKIEWSKGLRAIFDYEEGRPAPTFDEFLSFVHPDDMDFIIRRSNEQFVPLKEPRISYVYRIVTRTGAVKFLEHIGRQSFDGEGKLVGAYGSIQDITEKRRIEEELKESEEKFKGLVQDMQVGVLLQGPKAEILLCNPKALDLLGFSEERLLGKTSFDPDWNVIHEDGSLFAGETHPVPLAIATRMPVRNEIMGVVRTRDGDRVWLSVDAVPFIEDDGSVRHVVCTFTDITERKRAEDKVQDFLREKEFLLKEVHHRIKNNMSVISSLLAAQAGSLEPGSERAALLDASGRVQSMMVLYDKLYLSGDSYRLSAKAYFPALIDQIVGIFPKREGLRIEAEIEDIILGAKVLTPLGILVNELIANSMKYAFAERSGGTFRISLKGKGDRVLLEFGDDGIGLEPEGSRPSGFGMQLINMLVDQIDGTCSIEGGPGLKYTIEFKP